MLSIRGLDVGHGLCVHLAGPLSSAVFDCGTHEVSAEGMDRPWRALSEVAFAGPPISTFAISHLHWDHYSGFLRRVPNVAPDVAIRLPRLPEVIGHPGLRELFLARLLALDPSFGPLDIDLVRRIRRYAPHARPMPHSAGESFDAVEQTWDVLWPPRRIMPGEVGTTAMRRAVDAYDRAAEDRPIMQERLDQIRDSDTYQEMIRDLEEQEQLDLTSDDENGSIAEHTVPDDDEDSAHDGSLATTEDGHGPNGDEPLVHAGRLLRKAANSLSLVLAQGDSILLTGDATRTATNRAIAYGNRRRMEWLQTPHHGSKHYRSRSIANLASKVRFSSSGLRYRRLVSDKYDTQPGLHYRTNRHGDFTVLLRRGRIVAMHSDRPL